MLGVFWRRTQDHLQPFMDARGLMNTARLTFQCCQGMDWVRVADQQDLKLTKPHWQINVC